MHLPAIREFRIVNAPFALLSKLRERALTSRKSTRTYEAAASPLCDCRRPLTANPLRHQSQLGVSCR